MAKESVVIFARKEKKDGVEVTVYKVWPPVIVSKKAKAGHRPDFDIFNLTDLEWTLHIPPEAVGHSDPIKADKKSGTKPGKNNLDIRAGATPGSYPYKVISEKGDEAEAFSDPLIIIE